MYDTLTEVQQADLMAFQQLTCNAMYCIAHHRFDVDVN